MGALLKCNGHQVLDLDGILSENRFLRESLEQVREEKQLANEMGRKYKLALEQSTQRRRLGSSNQQDSNVALPHKQNKYSNICDDIKDLMARTSFPCPKDLDVTKPENLQELCLSLLETLNDRMLQFTQQKKANKQLMKRLEEVENQIQIGTNLEIGQLILHPSSFLMKDYSSANVDEEVNDPTIVNDALYMIDKQVKGSLVNKNNSDDNQPFSPDVADLYKRFQKISLRSSGCYSDGQPENSPSHHKTAEIKDNGITSNLTQNHPPPDLIAQDFVPRGVSYHAESLSISDIENDDSEYEDCPSDVSEKNEIILPEHLQRLVDKAMIDIVQEAEG